jgi:putative spermidine/putrescine transport system permease protein
MAEATVADSASLETGSAALKRAIRRVERRKQFVSAALIAPLFLFLAITFVVPIGLMLYRAVENPEIVDHLPRTAEAIESWDGETLPDEALYAKLGRDMVEAYYDRALAAPARRLNYELDGFRSTFMATARELPRERPEDGWKQAFLEADPVWGELRTWKAIQVTAKPYTAHYLLTALDLERTN